MTENCEEDIYCTRITINQKLMKPNKSKKKLTLLPQQIKQPQLLVQNLLKLYVTKLKSLIVTNIDLL